MSAQAQSNSLHLVENALKEEMRSGRFSHALILSGQSGIGKKTLARYLAKGLLCTHEDASLHPCGLCRSCKRFEAGTHANLLRPSLKASDKTIKIEAVRDILEALSRHSLEKGARVVLLEDAERMTEQAQNCLLKTLEEADKDTYFILTVNVERNILPTILSRCQIERMQPWTKEELEQALRFSDIPAQKIPELIEMCEGSIGRALAIKENKSFWDARELVMNTFFSIRRPADIPRCIALLKNAKDDSSTILDILEQEISRFLHEKVLNPHTDRFPTALWEKATPAGLQRILSAVLEARRYRASNVGWQPTAELLLLMISEETQLWQQ